MEKGQKKSALEQWKKFKVVKPCKHWKLVEWSQIIYLHDWLKQVLLFIGLRNLHVSPVKVWIRGSLEVGTYFFQLQLVVIVKHSIQFWHFLKISNFSNACQNALESLLKPDGWAQPQLLIQKVQHKALGSAFLTSSKMKFCGWSRVCSLRTTILDTWCYKSTV